jgi:uncharacterized membrane protein YcaP (DUF421 family)
MWQDVLTIQVPVLEKILRTVLVYAIIMVLFRLGGKRGLADLNMLDFAVVFLLSNVVQNAVIGNDYSVTGGAIGAVTLVAMNAALNRVINRSPRAARFLEGKQATVISNGEFVTSELHRLGLRPSELEHAVRMQNGDGVAEVAKGTLEPSGHLVVTLKPEEQGATKGDIELLLTRLAGLEQRIAAGASPGLDSAAAADPPAGDP